LGVFNGRRATGAHWIKEEYSSMHKIPHTAIPDTTYGLALEGYRFISNRCERYSTDIFKTRLGFKNTICLQGKAAAKMFYNTDHLKREGAVPGFVQSTLFGAGGVQGMDGQAHRHRKAMFMRLMNKKNITRLKKLT